MVNKSYFIIYRRSVFGRYLTERRYQNVQASIVVLMWKLKVRSVYDVTWTQLIALDFSIYRERTCTRQIVGSEHFDYILIVFNRQTILVANLVFWFTSIHTCSVTFELNSERMWTSYDYDTEYSVDVRIGFHCKYKIGYQVLWERMMGE
jgi:hypothetical protein